MIALLGKPFRRWRASARARVYSLRMLLCWNIIILVLACLQLEIVDLYLYVDLFQVGPLVVTVVHHICA
jgi:hypothetical protein